MNETHGCTCLASFPTKAALESHLNDYKVCTSQHYKFRTDSAQVQIEFHSARLTECRTHLSVDDHDAADSGDVSDYDDLDKSIKYCPHQSCSPSKRFKKGQGLRRHFATRIYPAFLLFHGPLYNNLIADVECNEVCVFCHKQHRIASEFLRHVKYYHLDKHGIKAEYMRKMAEELNEEVVRQLYRAKRACMKRGLEEANFGPETSQARRARPDEGTSATDHNSGDYIDQRAAVASAAGGIAVAPIDSFGDLVAREFRNEANHHALSVASLTTAEVTVAPINFQSTAQAIYRGDEPTQSGRYDPDITRITNWPASWDETVNQILNSIS
jgi:hypothetical protein